MTATKKKRFEFEKKILFELELEMNSLSTLLQNLIKTKVASNNKLKLAT